MIVVLGDVMTDVIVRPAGDLAHGTDSSARIVLRPGGSGANVACWLAHLGAEVAFVGRVGAADFSAQLDLLRRAGVVPHLAADEAAPTGTIVAIIDPTGERSFYTDRGANLSLCPEDLPAAVLDGADWLHVSGYALFAPSPRRTALAAMARARAAGVRFSVDVGSVAFLAEVGCHAFLAWTEGAALCFANAAEAAALGAGLRQYPCRVVTHGAAGAEAWYEGQHVRVAAAPVSHPETTGAGDAAAAGFLAAMVAGEPVPICLQRAVEAGSNCVGRVGARG
jgi:sugar/nucleoside kinase (ribokinase family)